MSADRELLELAYKALTHGADLNADKDMRRRWNPLTDDGDALRLAVKLGLCVDTRMDASSRFDTDEPCTLALLPRPSEQSFGEWHGYTDPYAATRRAIVRAAAEIGRAAS